MNHRNPIHKRMNNVRVLLIDRKNTANNALIALILKLGYRLLGCIDNGKAALEFVKKNPPDIILLNTHLEGEWDGVQTAEQLAKIIDIPFIYVSNQVDKTTIERAKRTRPADFLVMPLRDKDLEIALEFALANQ